MRLDYFQGSYHVFYDRLISAYPSVNAPKSLFSSRCDKFILGAVLTFISSFVFIEVHSSRQKVDSSIGAYAAPTEFSLPFLPIYRNDAMALVGSQGTILSTMASISSENVAARGDGV
jgi:hypothetical protein